MYDPTVGRWLSEDPIGFRDGANLHCYVGNLPVTFIDPLGLKTLTKGVLYMKYLFEPSDTTLTPTGHVFKYRSYFQVSQATTFVQRVKAHIRLLNKNGEILRHFETNIIDIQPLGRRDLAGYTATGQSDLQSSSAMFLAAIGQNQDVCEVEFVREGHARLTDEVKVLLTDNPKDPWHVYDPKLHGQGMAYYSTKEWYTRDDGTQCWDYFETPIAYTGNTEVAPKFKRMRVTGDKFFLWDWRETITSHFKPKDGKWKMSGQIAFEDLRYMTLEGKDNDDAIRNARAAFKSKITTSATLELDEIKMNLVTAYHAAKAVS